MGFSPTKEIFWLKPELGLSIFNGINAVAIHV